MQNLVRFNASALAWIAICTVAVSVVFLIIIWARAIAGLPNSELPYFGWILGIGLAEVIALWIAFTRQGLKYLPQVERFSCEADCVRFMIAQWKHASRVTIFTKTGSWLRLPEVVTAFNELNGRVNFEIVASDETLSVLFPGATVICSPVSEPASRITIINRGSTGSEKIMSGVGAYPEHEVYLYTTTSGAGIIAIAKDLFDAIRHGKIRRN